jgi:signal peptidase II
MTALVPQFKTFHKRFSKTPWLGDVLTSLVALVVILVDQVTKALVVARFAGIHQDDVVPVFGNVLSIVYLQNTGSAFSAFQNSPVILAILILIACCVIAWLYWSQRAHPYFWRSLAFGFIIGGAVGNLTDRVRLGYVVDFIHFQLTAVHFNFAVFNVADSCIDIGIFLLVISLWKSFRPSDSKRPETAQSDTPSG